MTVRIKSTTWKIRVLRTERRSDSEHRTELHSALGLLPGLSLWMAWLLCYVRYWHAQFLHCRTIIGGDCSMSASCILKNAVFWDLAPCRSCVNRHFGGTYRLHLQGRKVRRWHDSLCSRRACACSEADFSIQNGTVLEEYATEEQRSVVRFCGQKDSMQRIFIKKCFLFTVGNICHIKRFETRCQKFHWWRGWNGGAEVAETTVKRLLCCGFRRTGKAMGQVYQCWWRVRRERNVFPRLEYHMFYVLYPFVIYLLPLPRIYRINQNTNQITRLE
jgi:hypothetical protein